MDMKRHYLMDNRTIPKENKLYAQGILYTTFIEKKEYIDNHVFPLKDDKEKWRAYYPSQVDMPESLYFLNIEEEVLIDFYIVEKGFLISKELKEVMELFEMPSYVYSKVKAINRDGISNSKKEYYYIVFTDNCQFIDFEKSKFRKLHNPNELNKLKYPRIDVYTHAVVVVDTDTINPKDIFYINQPTLKYVVGCSDLFMNAVLEKGINTVEFWDINLIKDFFNNRLNNPSNLVQTKFIIE